MLPADPTAPRPIVVPASRPLRICYFGTYEKEYPRNRIAIEGLRRQGLEVLECHEEVWGLTRIKLRDYFRPASLLGLGLRYAVALIRLTRRHRRLGDYDVMVVGFNGHLDVFLARILTRIRKRPLVFNPLTSIFNTLVEDKAFFAPRSAAARLIRALEWLIYRLPDRIVLDTRAHVDYLVERFGLDRSRLAEVHVGADDRVFFPNGRRTSPLGPPRDRPFRVLYYGKYLPLHGVQHIIRAAKLLEGENFEFVMIGTGQFVTVAKEIYDKNLTREVPNIVFIDWVDYEELPVFIADADACLGIFGGTRKARMVVPNKAFQAIAMGKPLVTGESPAAHEVLDGAGEPAALLLPMADPGALADALRELERRPERAAALGARGHALFRERYDLAHVGRAFRDVIEDVVDERTGEPRSYQCQT